MTKCKKFPNAVTILRADGSFRPDRVEEKKSRRGFAKGEALVRGIYKGIQHRESAYLQPHSRPASSGTETDTYPAEASLLMLRGMIKVTLQARGGSPIYLSLSFVPIVN